MKALRAYSLIYLSFFIVLVLTIFPMPLLLSVFRPSWLILIVVYWVLALPHKIGAIHACLLGFFIDILLGSTLGVHALLLALVAYFVTYHYQRIRNFNVAKTTLTVGMLVFFNQLFLYWIVSSTQDVVLHNYYYLPVLTSMLIWPWFFLLMRMLRLKCKVE